MGLKGVGRNQESNKNKTCKVENCINQAVTKGFCKIHYSRFRTHQSFENRKYPIVANFSNLKKEKGGGRWCSPEVYICKFCGVTLTKENTYRNTFKYGNYICKVCNKWRSREFHRKYKLNSGSGAILLKGKIPEHPNDNKCMLCGRPPTRRTGLCFHHWIIVKGIACGVWLCCVCHMFAERYDNEFADKYVELKAKYLIVGRK